MLRRVSSRYNHHVWRACTRSVTFQRAVFASTRRLKVRFEDPDLTARLHKQYAFDNKENDDPSLRLIFEHVNGRLIPPNEIAERTPKMPTARNTADKIERQMRAIGHRVWGFVVYRSTYRDDAAWEACVQKLLATIRESIEECNGLDLLEDGSFKLTIMDNQELFDNATTHTIRSHFNSWCTQTYHIEQGSDEEIELRRDKNAFVLDLPDPARYDYCIQIDEESMQSINSDRDFGLTGWMKFIKRDWAPPEEELDEDEIEEDDKDLPPIEGSTARDVGWARVHLSGFCPGVYLRVGAAAMWDVMYRRPPQFADDV